MQASLPVAASRLLDFIASFEAPQGYDTIYGNHQKSLPKQITAMSLDEVLAAQPQWTRQFGSSAAGRYQFMQKTLTGLKSELRLTGREQFNGDLQDQLGYRLLLRRGFRSFVDGTLSLDAFALNLAKEWASLPVLQDTQGASRSVTRGQSYYAGDGRNKALVQPARVETVLNEVLSAPDSLKPTVKTETMMNSIAPAVQPASPSLASDPKPWYLSKGVIGGLIAVAIPIVSLFFPAARVINPETATDWIMKAVEVGGPIIGGLLAVVGRVQAVQPIGSKPANKLQPLLGSLSASSTGGMIGMPLQQILDQLPEVLLALRDLGQMTNGLSGVASGTVNVAPTVASTASQDNKVQTPEEQALSNIKVAADAAQQLAEIAPHIANAFSAINLRPQPGPIAEVR